MRNTEPRALILPRIWEGSLVVTRLTVTAAVEGWLKRTVSLLPTLKVRQSIAALALL